MTNIDNTFSSNTLWVVEVKGEEGFTPATRRRSKNFIAASTRSEARDAARVLRESGETTRVVGYTASKSNSGS
jgi:hypothetical protein|tara:strand:+ start:220 stop:438 length:219 start_codon:yes stop_codon:yes gene_type:complete